MDIEKMMEEINKRAIELVALLENPNKQTKHSSATQQALIKTAILGFDNCIKIYRTYVPKGNSPILDCIIANKTEIEEKLKELVR